MFVDLPWFGFLLGVVASRLIVTEMLIWLFYGGNNIANNL